ncbi:hypothetical protein RJT34_19479 [Clitoria ternatea]|uniref:Uncharacterized protein n=1 Tax=Clitoria ternatea TaxID=43366 RepID=A0AAN9IR34_CLITE
MKIVFHCLVERVERIEEGNERKKEMIFFKRPWVCVKHTIISSSPYPPRQAHHVCEPIMNQAIAEKMVFQSGKDKKS